MRFVLLFALVASTPAIASPDQAPSGDHSAHAGHAQTAPKAKEEKKICKRMAASETRMAAKRLCMTAAEWKRAEDELTR